MEFLLSVALWKLKGTLYSCSLQSAREGKENLYNPRLCIFAKVPERLKGPRINCCPPVKKKFKV